ncbi:hypothetical protein HMPREF9069_01081 [Atopobium sp. oral taxon 810 str. F0209]|nr:hypothetical protein HMPREF9069_01081 [Atopobium sp. oral taxon 810 str. F0209]
MRRLSGSESETKARADVIKGSGRTLLKNPEDLTDRQVRTLAVIQRESPELWCTYNLKKHFRDVFKSPRRRDHGEVSRLVNVVGSAMQDTGGGCRTGGASGNEETRFSERSSWESLTRMSGR